MGVLQVNPWSDLELARTLLGIQSQAYALEASLIRDDRIPALHEDLGDLRSAELLGLVVFIDHQVVGTRPGDPENAAAPRKADSRIRILQSWPQAIFEPFPTVTHFIAVPWTSLINF